MPRASLRATRARRRRRAGAWAAVVAVVLVVAVAAGAAVALGVWRTESASSPVAAVSPSVAPFRTPAPAPTSTPAVTSVPTPSPTPLSPAAQGCDGQTLLSVWAHPDDDIIFANPTISEAIAAGECVRTLFVTAGDAGKGLTYTHSRELGILRAYNHMRGSDGLWDSTVVTLDAGLRVERLTPQNDPRISVMFARLPDGNITDGGFAATGHATLSKLLDGAISALAPIDGGPAVDRAQLSASLTELAGAVQPARTLTHVPRGSAYAPGDHPDHSVVGTLVRESIGHVPAAAPGLRYAIGYPSADLPRTLDGAALDAKVETYRIYTQQDEVIRCDSREACLGTRKFGEWLRRSYLLPESDLRLS